jgi:hypothetical protein
VSSDAPSDGSEPCLELILEDAPMTFWNSHAYEKTLLALRSQLRDDINDLTEVAFDVVLDHRRPKAAAVCRSCRPFWHTSIARNFKEFARRLIEHKERMLDQIDAALDRLVDGTYGVCQRCDAAIPEPWLTAVPYTTLCATCDSQRVFE